MAQQASLFGSAMEDYRLTHGVTANQSNQDSSSGSANLNYKGRYGTVTLGRSQGSGYGQTNLGLAGGIVAHGDGVTLSQPLGETIALVRAQGFGRGHRVPGRRQHGHRGQCGDSERHPYRSNRLALITQDLGDLVDVKYAARDVVPTRGAVVLAPFETSVGYRLMLTLKDRDGRALPFGSRIENEAGRKSASSARRAGLCDRSARSRHAESDLGPGSQQAMRGQVRIAPRGKPTPVHQYEASCS